MSKYRNLILNVGLFAINAVATRLITFLLVPLYTNYMSAGEYGLTDMSVTVISLITPLVTLDVSEAAVRYIVGDSKNSERYAAFAFGLTLLSICLVAVLTPLLELSVFGGLGDYKAWFVLAYATTALMNLCGEIARGSGEVKLITLCAGLSSVVTLVSALVLIGNLGLGIAGYFLSVSIGPVLAILVYLTVGGLGGMMVRGALKLSAGGLAAVRETAAPMVRYALPLIPNALFWWVGTSINRFFITGMLGISASGMFAAAGKVPNLLNTAYSVFQQAWQLSAFQEAKDEGIARFYSSVYRVLSAGMTVLCALISLLAPLFGSIFLRGETYGAWPMIPVLLIANLMNVFNSFYGTVYTSTMRTGYIMRTTVFGALSCVVFTPLLIPIVGTYGACIASVVGQGLVFAMRARDSRKYIAFDAGWRTLLPTLAILAVQSAVTAAQFPEWRLVSLACVALVVVLQGRRLLPILGFVKSRVKRDK